MGSLDSRPTLRLGHSPDPDDAFMWWPLFAINGERPAIESDRFRFEPMIADIESLNRRSLDGDLEITAISCAQYPFVQDRYVMTACGASMGDSYGPKLVSRVPLTIERLRGSGALIAVPGERTSAFGALSLLLGRGAFEYAVVPFDQIIDRVAETASPFMAGVVIHEGQLTFGPSGLHLVEDLGAWWNRTHDLPLPLGINVVRRDLDALCGRQALEHVSALLARSVEYALANHDQGVRYAMQYSRGLGQSLTAQFIDLYVNKWTLSFGETGRRAVRRFLSELHRIGLTPACDGCQAQGAAL